MQLVDSDPEIWRPLEVPRSLWLGRVDEVLQTSFGWEDVHLHRFNSSRSLQAAAAGRWRDT